MEDFLAAIGALLYIGGMVIGIPLILWHFTELCNAGIPVTGLC